MPSLQIRKLPLAIYTALKAAAERERRSISQQAIVALSRGLQLEENFRDRRRRVLSEIQKDAYLWKDINHIDIATRVREDRDSR